MLKRLRTDFLKVRTILLVSFGFFSLVILAFSVGIAYQHHQMKQEVDSNISANHVLMQTRALDYAMIKEQFLGTQLLDAGVDDTKNKSYQDEVTKQSITNDGLYKNVMKGLSSRIDKTEYTTVLYGQLEDAYAAVQRVRKRLMDKKLPHIDSWLDVFARYQSAMNSVRNELFAPSTVEQFVMEQHFVAQNNAMNLFNETALEGAILSHLILTHQPIDQEMSQRLVNIRAEADTKRKALELYVIKIRSGKEFFNSANADDLVSALQHMQQQFEAMDDVRRQVYAATLLNGAYTITFDMWSQTYQKVLDSIAVVESVVAAPSIDALTKRQEYAGYELEGIAVAVSFFLLFVYGNFRLLQRRVLVPVSLITERMTSIAQGNVDVELPHGEYNDEIGSMLKSLSVFRDSVRKAFEQASLLRLAEEVAHLGNWKYNVSDQRLIWSDEVYRIYGVRKEDVTLDLEFAVNGYLESDRQLVRDYVQQAVDYKVGFRMEATIRQPSGDERYVEARAMCELSDTGEVTSVFGTFQDITERKIQERELDLYRERLEKMVYDRTKELNVAKEEAERASASKSEFLSNMSHELRTPMHAILSYAGMGIKNHSDSGSEKVLKYFNNIQTSGKRLMGLLNDLLDLSKLEAGKMTFNYTKEPLGNVIEKARTELNSLLEDKRLGFSMTVESHDAAVVMDSLRIMQVVVNILSNAIKFSPQETHIAVVIEDTQIDMHGLLQPAVMCSIKDQGIGIPEDELGAVFDKFIQSSKTKTGAGGTGLGLSICREIILAHGGKIFAENAPEGGAVFKFMLPREQISTVAASNRSEDDVDAEWQL